MKKMNIMKSVAAMALAVVAVGCSHDTDLYDQNAKELEFSSNFVNNVLGGQQVDGRQTWSTATKVTIKVNSEMSGTLQIFTANPLGNLTPVLITKTLNAGSTTLTVAKPNDAKTLYAALVDADGSMRVMEVSNNTVNFAAPQAIPASARKVQKKYNNEFPDAPADDKFLTAVPSGVKSYDEVGQWGYASGTSYLDETHTGEVNIWGGWDGTRTSGGTLYIKGNNDYSNRRFYVAPNTEIYLLAGATLTLRAEDSGNLQAGSNIYMATGSKLKTNGELKLNSWFVYNRGTIEAPVISGNGTGTIYNQGTVKVDGELSVTNAATTIVNEGTITAASYGSYGSGNFWNKEGDVTISGTTTVNSNANVWINEGQYTTGEFNYTAGSINVWNLCKLTVKGNFKIQLGDSPTSTFSMDAGSSVVTETFEMQGPGRVNMAGNSLFKVNTTATMNITKAEYGIYGPTSGDQWAVFQAKDIVKGTENQGYEITYGGNLYVASDSHFANGYSGQYPYIDYVGNAKICNGQATAPYVIPANGECSAGYNGGVTPPVPPVMYYYYAFEDLGTTDDFDFNDVVIRLSAPTNGQSAVQIVAAGGTMATYVTYGVGENPSRLGAEVHAAMGESSIQTMINTSGVDTEKFATLGTISIAADADLTMLPFGIQVIGNDGTTTRVTRSVLNTGRAPLVIVVNGNDEGKWFWPTERTNIAVAYEDFGAWGANVQSNPDWYKNPTRSVVSY